MPFAELDASSCEDYIRALLLVDTGVAVRRALCPPSPAAASSTSGPGASSSSSSADPAAKQAEEDDAKPAAVDLIVRNEPTAVTNRVFTVINQLGMGGAVIVKQFLPHHRTHTAARLPPGRDATERLLATAHGALCPDKFANLLHADADQGILIYERLEPHVVARMDLIVGNVYPLIAEDVSSYLARALFGTSIWASADKRPEGAKAGLAEVEGPMGNNAEMAAVLAEVMIDMPFRNAPAPRAASGDNNNAGADAAPAAVRFPNKHTPSPVLDAWETAIRADSAVQSAASRLRERLLSARQALVHGDFHTGSVMTAVIRPAPKKLDYESMRAMTGQDLSAEEFEVFLASQPPAVGDLRVLDGEGAFLGPVGLDIGTFVAHLLIALAATRSRVRAQEAIMARGGYAKYSAERTRELWATHSGAIADVIGEVWSQFVGRFVDAWDDDRGAQREEAPPAACKTAPAAPHDHAGHGHEHEHEHGPVGAGAGGCATDPCCGGGCESETAAPAKGQVIDDGYWRTQISEMGTIFSDALGFAGAEMVRRVLGAFHTADLEKIEAPRARAAAEVRVLALGRYLLLAAEGIAAATTRASLASGGRTAALRTMASAMDAIVSAAGALDGETGWASMDNNGAITGTGYQAGRPAAATVVMTGGGSASSDALAPGTEGGLALRRVALSSAGEAPSPSFPASPNVLWEPLDESASTLPAIVRRVWGPVVVVCGAGASWSDVSSGLAAAEAGSAFVAGCGDGAGSGPRIVVLPPHAAVLLDAAAGEASTSSGAGSGAGAGAGKPLVELPGLSVSSSDLAKAGINLVTSA
jgi:5-methylthioribose kinase